MFSKSSLATQLKKVGADGFVSAADVVNLRGVVFKDGIVSREELAALFALGEHAPAGDPQWPMFFEEAATDFFLREEEPHGYLTDEEFASLEKLVTRDGGKASALELRLLVRLLEEATQTPAAMGGFIAEQLRVSILGKDAGPQVTADEVALLRRFIYARGGAGNLAVSRLEAELLFDINDAALGKDNDPAWTDLFVKSIANCLMAHFGYAAPSREEAVQTQDFMENRSVNVGGFFRRMFSGGLGAAKGAYADDGKSAQAKRNEEREAGIAVAEQITGSEADWLSDRIGRDGTLHASERALIDYMRALGGELPPKLKDLADKAA